MISCNVWFCYSVFFPVPRAFCLPLPGGGTEAGGLPWLCPALLPGGWRGRQLSPWRHCLLQSCCCLISFSRLLSACVLTVAWLHPCARKAPEDSTVLPQFPGSGVVDFPGLSVEHPGVLRVSEARRGCRESCGCRRPSRRRDEQLPPAALGCPSQLVGCNAPFDCAKRHPVDCKSNYSFPLRT